MCGLCDIPRDQRQPAADGSMPMSLCEALAGVRGLVEDQRAAGHTDAAIGALHGCSGDAIAALFSDADPGLLLTNVGLPVRGHDN